MHSKSRSRFWLAAAGLALAALTACAEPPPPPTLPPPPPPPLPAITLAPSVIEEAGAYRADMARASGITPPFMDGLAIQTALKTGAAYEPRQFLRGAIAYAAVVALQDPAFVAGVRKFAADPAQRQEVAANLVIDPAYVVGMDGSASAAGLVTKALRGDSTRLFVAGQAVKQSAYTIQHQLWSRAAVPEREARLIQAKALSTQPLRGDIADVALLQQAAIGAASLNISADAQQPPYTPLVIRGLAVAALAALGEATETNTAQLDALLSDPSTAYCLNMGKLNLYQCLAVSKPHYEDVFCLGQHIMMDTGQCLMKGSGAPMPIAVSTKPLAVPPAGPMTVIPPKTTN
jgi:hypothetical protein